MTRLFAVGFLILLVSGCASYGVVENAPLEAANAGESYSIQGANREGNAGEIALILALSGGGTRAAALAYGVLEELRDTRVATKRGPVRLLDEVDTISSVSGGSFAAAYYGLYGDRIFTDFEDAFLRRNVEGHLIGGLLNPLRWFSPEGRTEMAIDYYQKILFRGATYADLKRKDTPLILINASDLGYGVRFSFAQEYFNLLCSDLSSFPVARAVAASSAVPVLFNPVVVENYPGCSPERPPWLVEAERLARHNPQMAMTVEGLESYFDKAQRKYAHFVDGGITDNLGLRAPYDVVAVSGGPKGFLRKAGREVPRRLVIISVNASTDPKPAMDRTNKQPGLKETIDAVTDVQLHRYNAATLELMQQSMKEWAHELSQPGSPVTSYFIQLGFRDFANPETRGFFNRVPTSFSLTDEQVDRSVAAGHDLLRNNSEFRRLLSDLDAVRVQP